MSCPPFVELPPGARAYRLGTARGSFAVHEAVPAGEPRGTALLVPGFTGSKEDFIALLGPLSCAGFRAVAVDQRGQYESGGPRDEGAYAIDELARDLLALTEALGDKESGHRESDGSEPAFHVLGHSFGALVVRAAVLDHGSPPWASLTVLSSGPAALDAAGAASVKLLREAIPTLGMEGVWQAMRQLDVEQGTPLRVTPEVLDFLHTRWLANVPEQLMTAGKQLLEEPDRVDELASVPLPKLVISGVTDNVWPVAWMDEMAVRLKAERVVIEGAGHSPNVETPEETARALVSFWTSVERGSLC